MWNKYYVGAWAKEIKSFFDTISNGIVDLLIARMTQVASDDTYLFVGRFSESAVKCRLT